MEVKEAPLVYIIVITYNGKHHLQSCLPSVFSTNYPNYKVILIDNASTDGTPEFVGQSFPAVEIISNPVNYGFAKGNNIAIKKAIEEKAEYIVLLNDDTVILDPNWLQYAVALCETDKQIGMVGFELTDNLSESSSDRLEFKPVNRIAACAIVIKREVLENIGYFDEVYFAYGEDNDLEERAMKAGYQMYQLNIPLFHKGSGSFSQVPRKKAFLVARNWMRFSIKQEPIHKIFLRPFVLCDIFCNPYPIRRRKGDKLLRRKVRTKSHLFNCVVVFLALFWNLIFLPQTLFIRWKENQLINKTKSILVDD
jgi:GT2 family glycosyltransferase